MQAIFIIGMKII